MDVLESSSTNTVQQCKTSVNKRSFHAGWFMPDFVFEEVKNFSR
jgi:hypothetical protein